MRDDIPTQEGREEGNDRGERERVKESKGIWVIKDS